MSDDAELRAALAGATDVLVRTLRALGQNGQPEAANRLAARAYWALRPASPDEAERINGTMHYLARLEAEAETPPPPTAPPGTTPPTHQEEA